MEIIVDNFSYDNPNIEEDDFLREVKKDAAELSDNFEIRETDVGRGADILVSLIIISIGTSLISGLDVMIKYSIKFREWLNKNKKI